MVLSTKIMTLKRFKRNTDQSITESVAKTPSEVQMNKELLGTSKPVFTPIPVYGVTLHLVKPPSWGKVSGAHPSRFLFLARNL